MATPAEQIAKALEALEGLLADPDVKQKLDVRAKTAIAASLPAIRAAENIRTATGRSTIKLGEQRQVERLRGIRDRRKLRQVRVADAQKRLETVAKRFVESGPSRVTAPAMSRARDAFIRLGGSPAIAEGIENEVRMEREIKRLGQVRKQREESLSKKPKRLSRQEQTTKGQERQLQRLGLSRETKIPGGGTIAETMGGSRGSFGGGLRKIAGRQKLFSGLKKTGLIGGAAAIGIPLLLKLMGGGKKQVGAELPPEIQMQLMQAMSQGGGRGVDPALGTGRDLRNVFQLLQIIKTLRDMQGLQQQPTGGLI